MTEFTDEELENTPWIDLPNVYFLDGINSRSQELARAKRQYYNKKQWMFPQMWFMNKADWEDILCLEIPNSIQYILED